MATFLYKGVDLQGALITGSLEAETADDARVKLASKDLTVLGIKKATELFQRLNFFGGKVTRRDAIEFSKNLATILRAGISMLEGLSDIAQATEKKLLRNAILDIKEKIVGGSTLSEALGPAGPNTAPFFPEILARMVRIGEETGRLERSLSQVADHLQRLDDLAGTIKRALIYPIFILVAIGSALIFWLLYVMPKLLAVVLEMGVEMPLATKMMLALSNGARAYWYALPVVLVGIVVAFVATRKRESVRYYLDLARMRLPVVRLFVFNGSIASFAEQMSVLILAGITVDRALTVAMDSMGSDVYRRAIRQIRERILAGSRISDAVREHTVFPRMVSRLIDIGETSGNLGDQFAFISDHYGKKVRELSEKLGKLIEPLMMSVVGIIFVFMMIAILLPMYEVIGKLK